MADDEPPIDLGPRPQPVDLEQLADQLIALGKAADTCARMSLIVTRHERVLALNAVHKAPALRDRLIAAEADLWERYSEASDFIVTMSARFDPDVPDGTPRTL